MANDDDQTSVATPPAHSPSVIRYGHDGDGAANPVTAVSESETLPVASRLDARQRGFVVAGAVVTVLFIAYLTLPLLVVALNTVSTNDAYINGHVTFVAPRVPGQVTLVLVDDNNRVKKGDLLVQLDPEPYQVQVDIKRAAVMSAEADLAEANAQVRALVGQTFADRYRLENAMEQVNDQIANLRADVATLRSRKAELELARSNFHRAKEVAPSGGISEEELDFRRQTEKADEAMVEQALQAILARRAGLGLTPEVPDGHDLSDVPSDLAQNFSTVRESLAQLIESAAQLGYYPASWNGTPAEIIADLFKQDTDGNLDRTYDAMISNAPVVKQAEAKLEQARRDLEQSELNLRYCNIVSEIDGVVTRRNVNPGNNVQAGQSLMAVRSLTEIWVDANFKETQLSYLQIGQRAQCEVDMYGRKQNFEGRITGFTMGTGQTLALLPPQNATGNFVKIVQRLPVRIEFTDYDPTDMPLFVGLSVVPHVYYKELPTRSHARSIFQPNVPLPQVSTEPKP